MASETFSRKLTALLSADVVGYSRMMGSDEAGTIRLLTESRAIMAETIRHHRGRVVDATGDNILAEFTSAVDAVDCAAKIQEALALRNEPLPETQRMRFRIGINLGDVIEEKGCLYGDGVNIAARLEALAPAGGVCISGSIFDQVSGKLPFQFDAMGEQKVKNINRPVRAYRLTPPSDIATIETKPPPATTIASAKARRRLWPFVIVLLVISGLAGLYAAWQADWELPRRLAGSAGDKGDPIAVQKKPVIAVLPFENMSRDEAFDHFADGLTDDIITNLSQLSGLSVIARNSVFTYKGRPTKTQVLAQELDVQYVLEGSLRSAGDQILMNVQLIDAPSGHHIWAERYDMKVKDLFAIQVDITTRIASALNVVLTEQDKATLQEKGNAYLEAYLEKLQSGGQPLLPEEKDTRAEMIFWESIKDSQNPAMFQEYLRQFPDGIFAGLAKINSEKPDHKKPRALAETPPEIKITPPPPAAVENKKKADTSDKDKAEKVDTARLEETFWRSIQGSTSIAEYTEFLHKFPDGLFAGLARIKIETLTESSRKRQRPGADGKITLAILPQHLDIHDPYGYIFQNQKERDSVIARGIKMALSKKPLYTLTGSAFPMEGDHNVDIIDMEKLSGHDRLWFKASAFQREEPNKDVVCDIGNAIGVEAALMISSNDDTAFSQRVDLFLVDINSGKIFSETFVTMGRSGVEFADVRDSLLKLFDQME